ncbi:acyl-CoA dehydrogenase family protein [Myxococcota bacterium]|nr:acyl-CoA dehydrogenase family protein [Myxococcota bacterium]
MANYLTPAMSLYLDQLVDWPQILKLWRGDEVDVEGEVGAFRSVLETAASLVEGFQDEARRHWADEAELTADGGAVSPPHICAAYERLRESGLVSLSVSECYGGFGLPTLVNGLFLEMVSRADPSLMMVVGLQTGAAADIEKYGSEEIKQAVLPRFTSGEFQGCMDLTEPQAGSDLGGIQTRSTDLGGDRVRVDGQKIYISNGGAEVHLVLARDDDSYEESKGTTNGLSLIMVKRHRDDGTLNGLRVTRLERKLGIHGSATCEVLFEGAEGVRLGAKGHGFRAMLDLMNNARLGVASQALGLAEAALHDAVVYAQQREQFGKPIAEQPMVRSILAKMSVNAEAVRALLYRTYKLVDLNLAREAALKRTDLSEMERVEIQEELERDSTRVRLLTPLCKYFATEVCDDLTRDAMQVLGGIGYTMDSDVAKLHADSLIMTVYEGTSEIQASFALREIGKGALNVMFDHVRGELDEIAADPTRAELVETVKEMSERVDIAAKVLFSDIPYALLRSKLMIQMVIDVVVATEFLHQAAADENRIDLAADWIHRCAMESEHMSKRIESGLDDRIDRDMRLFELATTSV